MTYEERINSIKLVWDMLKTDGLLVVIDTPNRLHHFDGHSSMLPFYHWLPDEIAIQYSKFSPRTACVNIGEDKMKFIRFGRGVSYHEFEIALGRKCVDFDMYDLSSFENSLIRKIAVYFYKRIWKNMKIVNFSKILKKLGPSGIHNGFYQDVLYIAIKKSHS